MALVGNTYLTQVTYTSKTNPNQQTVLVVNVTEKAINYNGITVDGYGYIKVK